MEHTNKVACFFTTFKNNKRTATFSEECVDLIEYWKKSWAANGWDAYVLNESDLTKDEYYNALKFDNFDESVLCKNTLDFDCEYSRACYMRWLAYYQFAEKHGEIFWADYDVINYGLTPENNVEVNTVLCGCNTVGKQNATNGKKILDAILSVENEEVEFDNIHPTKKINDLFVLRKFAPMRVHKSTLYYLANEKRLQNNKPVLVDYHNGMYNKSRPKTENSFVDLSEFIYPNGIKKTRMEAVKIIEKLYGMKHYG